MAQRIGSLMVGLGLALGGCGDGTSEPGGPDSGVDTSPVGTPPYLTYCTPAQGTATRSALTCVETDVGVTPVTPNPQCAEADSEFPNPGGLTYPFGGLTVGGTSYTCNGCPNGHPDIQGRWRFHMMGRQENPDLVDYTLPDPVTDYAQVLFVDGNTFYWGVRDVQEQRTAQHRGYYFCSMRTENSAKHIYWVFTDSDESDSVSRILRTDTILSGGSNNFLFSIFDSPTGGSEFQNFYYCRFGSSKDGHTCGDPMDSF